MSVNVTAAARESLQAQICRVLNESLHIEIATPETDLLETGLLDSLGLVELLMRLEQGFGVKVDLEALDFGLFRSVATIAEFVARATERR
jgi:acyl carrier protein